MSTSKRLGAPIALAALLALVTAGVVQAGIYDQDSWDERGADTGVCDRYVVDWHWWGSWQIQDATAATNYQFFHFSTQWNLESVVTNPGNGEWFTEDAHGAYAERHARPLDDDVFAFNTMERSRYEVADSDGRIVYRDPALVLLTWQFDTLGDSAPGGETPDGYPIELANTWDQRFDFCALADELIG
jgi:hypothetical protein